MHVAKKGYKGIEKPRCLRVHNKINNRSSINGDFSKKSLGNANILVNKFSKTLNNNEVHGRIPRRIPLLSKKSFVKHLKFTGE